MSTLDYAISVATHMQAQGKLAQAKLILNSVLEVNSTHAYTLHLLGIISYQSGDIASGIKFIQQAITSDPTVALFHSNLGEMHRLLKANDLSIECGRRAIELDANSAVYWSNLGIAYYDMQQYSLAEDCHKRALTIDPKMSASLNNLGSIYKVGGDTARAIAFYQAAIMAAPQEVEFLNNLAVLYLEQQAFNKALKYLQRALQLAPMFAETQCNMGLAWLGLNYYDKAFHFFEKALQCKTDCAHAFFGKAKIYLRKYDFKLAEQAIRTAIAINVKQIEYYQILAQIYHDQGYHLQALQVLDQAFLIEAAASLYISKGTMFMERGEIAQAQEQFIKLADDPKIDNRVLAYYSLVQFKKIKIDDPSLQALLSINENIKTVSENKLDYFYFALGKCYDDLGDPEQAFAFFTQGCKIKRNRIAYNIADDIQFTQKIIQCFTKKTIEDLRAFANPSAVPIFIVGMPRSGTTLVEQILASHPHVAAAGELTYLCDLINSPIEGQNLPYPENIQTLSPENFSAITEKYLLYLRQIFPEAMRVTDKMPKNFIAIGLIHALFPNAKIIHVKRNPIDTCLSCYTKLFTEGQYYSYDLTELGQYYQCYERIMQHWHNVLPANAWLDVEYENVIYALEAQAKRLIAYCDLDWDPACVAFHQSKRQVRTASFMQVRQPIYKTSVSSWRKYEKELAPLIEVLGL